MKVYSVKIVVVAILVFSFIALLAFWINKHRCKVVDANLLSGIGLHLLYETNYDSLMPFIDESDHSSVYGLIKRDLMPDDFMRNIYDAEFLSKDRKIYAINLTLKEYNELASVFDANFDIPYTLPFMWTSGSSLKCYIYWSYERTFQQRGIINNEDMNTIINWLEEIDLNELQRESKDSPAPSNQTTAP
ncbi:MAG: hypothetical protein JJT75_07840 [Opitutales bacterium]|nr:hypothetical protein [Opitutales bacterium]